jgi:DUF4097 and DUF4098 domain-containing protein YvlB
MNFRSSRKHSELPRALVATLLASALPLAQAATENNLEKTFSVTPGGKLILDVDRGSIDLTSGNGSEVKVEVFRKVSARTKSKEQELLREHQVNFQQEGNIVTVRSLGKRVSSKWWNWDRTRFEFRYVVSVPQKFNVDLKTSGGGISAEDLIGDVKVRTSGGGLRLSKIQGPITGHTSGGGITLGECKGAIKVDTSGGGIGINAGEGNLSAETSGGSIQIKQFKGDAVVKTSGGGIASEQIEGNLVASTSGGSIAASLAGQPSGDCRLKTSGGNINVRLKESTALDIDASTSGGHVNSDLPVTVLGEAKHSSLRGKMNGGGKSLVLHTSGGNINLRKL